MASIHADLKTNIMKRFIIALAAVIAAFGFTSCEKEASKAIVGTWEATTVEMQMGPVTMEMVIAETGSEMKVTFKKDGVATMTETSEGESITMDLSYSVEDNILIMEGDGERTEFPITIEKKHMTWTIDGELLDEPDTKIIVHFEKI